jgi:hypothetical protein
LNPAFKLFSWDEGYLATINFFSTALSFFEPELFGVGGRKAIEALE